MSDNPEEQRLYRPTETHRVFFRWLYKRAAGLKDRLQSRISAVVLRALLFDMGLIAAILVLLWTSLGVHLLQEKRRTVEEAERTSSNLAGAAEQVLARTIEAVDQRLLFIREAYRADRLGFSLDFLRESNGFVDSTTLQIAVIGPTGRLRMTNLGPVGNGIDLSDRPHFRFHVDNPADELFISVPVLGRESNRWSIQFTRKLRERDGSFAGVVVASLDPIWLTHLYETLDIGQGVMTLVGQDGVVRARAPHLATALGSDIGGTGILDTLLSQQRGSMRMISPLDGVDRIISHRSVSLYPLIVLVGRDVAELTAAYVSYRRLSLMIGGGLTVLVLIAGFLMLRHKWHQVVTQQALSDAIENIDQGLILVDRRGRVPVLNRRFQQLLGLPSELLASRPHFGAIVKWQREAGEFGPSDTLAAKARLDMPRGIATKTALPGSGMLPSAAPVYERTRPDGTILEIRTQFLENGGAVRTYADVTERRRGEERIRFLAHHDALTGLANRFLLHEQLDSALNAAQQTGQTMAVLALDLDGFKTINDTLGHAMGDLLLAQVASRLLEAVRVGDTIARMGGDEFVILQVGVPQPSAAEALVRRLVARLSEPFLLQGREACVGCSVGLALFPRDGATAEELLRRADMALYRAKSDGKGSLCFFQPEMENRSQERSLLERDLRRALAPE